MPENIIKQRPVEVVVEEHCLMQLQKMIRMLSRLFTTIG